MGVLQRFKVETVLSCISFLKRPFARKFNTHKILLVHCWQIWENMESKFILIANNKHVKAEKKYQFPSGLRVPTGRVSQELTGRNDYERLVPLERWQEISPWITAEHGLNITQIKFVHAELFQKKKSYRWISCRERVITRSFQQCDFLSQTDCSHTKSNGFNYFRWSKKRILLANQRAHQRVNLPPTRVGKII